MLNLFKEVADLATALGVLFAGWQLYLSQRQARTSFEDQVSNQYREIVRNLPINALLGEPLSDEEMERALPDFFHYIDLCNEQAYLSRRRRIRKSTWKEWEDGIRDNLIDRPAFSRAWQIIAARAPDSFAELREVAPPAVESPIVTR